jgi:hypothetical protein
MLQGYVERSVQVRVLVKGVTLTQEMGIAKDKADSKKAEEIMNVKIKRCTKQLTKRKKNK